MNDGFKKGDRLVCLIDSGYVFLTEGKVYTVVEDEEPGIFPDRPYVTVTSDHPDRTLVTHTSRFVPHDGEAITPAKLAQLKEALRNRLSGQVA